MSFCGNFPFLFHSWQYNIQESIKDPSTGEIVHGVMRWCTCGMSEIYNSSHRMWYPSEIWYGWRYHMNVENPIIYLMNKLQSYGVERRLQNYQNIDHSYFEGTKDNFLVKSLVDKSVLCKVVTDVLRTRKHTAHQYIRYQVFTFKITPTQVIEELLLATFRIDNILNPIIELMNKR